mgnify:CR=1 FL=1
MSKFILYPWQQADWVHLKTYILQDRVPQALLLSAVEGMGAESLALRYTQTLLCLQLESGEACQHCTSCQLFLADTHPDFLCLQPEESGKAIRIDNVRLLIEKLALKPQYAAYRVVLIQPADKMNINAANALLKCLEEPPERTVFILLSHSVRILPATIISRCQKLSCELPDKLVVMNWLQSQGVEQAESLTVLAQGIPLLALDYAKNDSFAQRASRFHEWSQLLLGQACPVELAESWSKLSIGTLLEWLVLWTEDIIKCQFQSIECLLLNQDLSQELQTIATQVNSKKIFYFYDLLLLNRDRINKQLNTQLLVEELLIQWSLVGENH